MTSFQIIRIFVKDGTESHSIEYKETYLEAQQRYYNIIATDLANEAVTYQAAYIINCDGLMLDGKVFDRTPVESEV